MRGRRHPRLRRARRWMLAAIGMLAAALALTASAVLPTPVYPTVASAAQMWQLPAGVTHAAAPGMIPQVGVLADADGTIDAFHCTGDVIASATGLRVITAGHCMMGIRDDGVIFAPGYHDGVAPYGVWHSTRVVRDERWSWRGGNRFDQAYIEFAPLDGRTLVDVVGALPVAWDAQVDQPTAVQLGYPIGSADLQLCRNTTKRYARSPDQDYLQIACPGMASGVSGGAWLIPDPEDPTAPGAIIGFTGGVFDPFFGNDVSTGLHMTSAVAQPFLEGR